MPLSPFAGAVIVRRYGISIRNNLDVTALRKTLKFSLGNYTAGIFLMAPTTVIPVMIVNTIGAEENAYFYVAYSVASLLLLFSKEYSEEAFEMLRLLAASSIFSAVISIFVTIKKIQKDVRMINYLNFALSALIIGLGYAALLKYGLMGLGYAWLGANAVVCAAVVGVVSRERWI